MKSGTSQTPCILQPPPPIHQLSSVAPNVVHEFDKPVSVHIEKRYLPLFQHLKNKSKFTVKTAQHDICFLYFLKDMPKPNQLTI